MTIEEQITIFEHNAEHERKEGDLNNCLHFRQLAQWLKELKAHREAWEKIKAAIKYESNFAYADFDEYKYEVLGIDDVDDLPSDDYRYGMERALELIDNYRPKEGENE